uniref:Uncharacterized protein n=1 Tax=Glossina palpalis gambiensis TaxID=67801 RepID=A0A1B0BX69_9MUSC
MQSGMKIIRSQSGIDDINLLVGFSTFHLILFRIKVLFTVGSAPKSESGFGMDARVQRAYVLKSSYCSVRDQNLIREPQISRALFPDALIDSELCTSIK